MKRFSAFLLVFMFSSFHSSAKAQTFCSTQGDRTKILFINGMNNTYEDAAESYKELRRRVKTAQRFGIDFNGETLTVEMGYNHLEGFWDQLFQVIKQKIIEDSTWTAIVEHRQGLNSLTPAQQNEINNLSASLSQSIWLVDADLRRMLDRTRELIDTGSKVVAVSHSQGNFYANNIYNLLNDGNNSQRTDSYGIVSLGTPTDHVAGGGQYYTLTDDKVMGLVRFLRPDTLDGNLTNTAYMGTPDFLRHNFIRSYLNGIRAAQRLGSGFQMMHDIASTIRDLLTPIPILDGGIITVRLGWGAQPDVDLHIFEPNGRHVFWRNKVGISGVIDKDDTNGFGPEHYRVNCESLEAGDYDIGVNYFSGSAPEVAAFLMTAGSKTRLFSVPLPMAFGFSGDFSPIPAGTITVTGDAINGYSFQLR